MRRSDVICFFWEDESMGIIIAQIETNNRNKTCLNMFETTIAPHLHQIIIQISLSMPKNFAIIYAQIMGGDTLCLQNGCSLGSSVFPGQKRHQQSLKALPSPWNGAASSGAWIGAHARHAAVALHAVHWLGPVGKVIWPITPSTASHRAILQNPRGNIGNEPCMRKYMQIQTFHVTFIYICMANMMKLSSKGPKSFTQSHPWPTNLREFELLVVETSWFQLLKVFKVVESNPPKFYGTMGFQEYS